MAITITAAKNCGIDEYVGTLEVGKDADIVIFDAFPTEFNATVKDVFVNGNKII